MKIVAMTMMVAAAQMVAQPKHILNAHLSPVTVYVHASVGRPPICAEALASEMFTNAGVRIHWEIGWGKADRQKQPILIDITANTPKMLHPGALAYAQLHEGVHIRIFKDRIDTIDDACWTNKLLAHVLVHEITHVLEGGSHHSEHGIMKAHWTIEDFLQMRWKTLPFDLHDVALIHDGLARSRQRP